MVTDQQVRRLFQYDTRGLPKDVAANLGVSVPTLYRWIPAGQEIPSGEAR